MTSILESYLRHQQAVAAAQSAIQVVPIGDKRARARADLRALQEAPVDVSSLSPELVAALAEHGVWPKASAGLDVVVMAQWRVAAMRVRLSERDTVIAAAETALAAAVEGAKSSAWKRKGDKEAKEVVTAKAAIDAARATKQPLLDAVAPFETFLAEHEAALAEGEALRTWQASGFTGPTPACIDRLRAADAAEFMAEATVLPPWSSQPRVWTEEGPHVIGDVHEPWSATTRRIRTMVDTGVWA